MSKNPGGWEIPDDPVKSMEFKPGDVVCLKSGGHDMTVSEIRDDQVFCVWSDSGRRIKERLFQPQLLQFGDHKGVVHLTIVTDEKL